jgi:type I restriction enzyme R subunit
VVSEYRHEQAVRDRVNVPYQVYEIRTRVSEEGGTSSRSPTPWWASATAAPGPTRWESLDEDVSYTARQLDRSVVVPDQIRTVLRELRSACSPRSSPDAARSPRRSSSRSPTTTPRTSCASCARSGRSPTRQAVKITYKPERQRATPSARALSHKPEELIQAFRNSPTPRVAVTVDMIATGTDIKPWSAWCSCAR